MENYIFKMYQLRRKERERNMLKYCFIMSSWDFIPILDTDNANFFKKENFRPLIYMLIEAHIFKKH